MKAKKGYFSEKQELKEFVKSRPPIKEILNKGNAIEVKEKCSQIWKEQRT